MSKALQRGANAVYIRMLHRILQHRACAEMGQLVTKLLDDETLDNLAREASEIPLKWGEDFEILVREYRILKAELDQLRDGLGRLAQQLNAANAEVERLRAEVDHWAAEASAFDGQLAAANAVLERVRALRDRHAHQARGSVFSTALVEFLDEALAAQPATALECPICGGWPCAFPEHPRRTVQPATARSEPYPLGHGARHFPELYAQPATTLQMQNRDLLRAIIENRSPVKSGA